MSGSIRLIATARARFDNLAQGPGADCLRHCGALLLFSIFIVFCAAARQVTPSTDQQPVTERKGFLENYS